MIFNETEIVLYFKHHSVCLTACYIILYLYFHLMQFVIKFMEKSRHFSTVNSMC